MDHFEIGNELLLDTELLDAISTFDDEFFQVAKPSNLETSDTSDSENTSTMSTTFDEWIPGMDDISTPMIGELDKTILELSFDDLDAFISADCLSKNNSEFEQSEKELAVDEYQPEPSKSTESNSQTLFDKSSEMKQKEIKISKKRSYSSSSYSSSSEDDSFNSRKKSELVQAVKNANEAAAKAEVEADVSPAELKQLKREKKKARNRQLAFESRERKKQKMSHLEEENKRLRELNTQLKAHICKLQGKESSSDDERSLETSSTCSSSSSFSSSVTSSGMRRQDAVLAKGAAAIGATMSMIVMMDSSSPSSPMSDGSFELIGFWALGWDVFRHTGLSLSAVSNLVFILFTAVIGLAILCLPFYTSTVFRGVFQRPFLRSSVTSATASTRRSMQTLIS